MIQTQLISEYCDQKTFQNNLNNVLKDMKENHPKCCLIDIKYAVTSTGHNGCNILREALIIYEY